MKINHYGRVPIEKSRVEHFVELSSDRLCFVCGHAAQHAVADCFLDDGSHIYLCNKHFAMMFKLPPTRHKRKHKPVAAKQPLLGIREYSLRRYLNTPYKFTGERIVYREYDTAHYTWFFSLYRQDKCRDNTGKYVVSITRLFHGEDGERDLAIHGVQYIGSPSDYSVANACTNLLGWHHDIQSYRLSVPVEVTKFIEKCEQVMV